MFLNFALKSFFDFETTTGNTARSAASHQLNSPFWLDRVACDGLGCSSPEGVFAQSYSMANGLPLDLKLFNADSRHITPPVDIS
jgi:hypothetical protein